MIKIDKEELINLLNEKSQLFIEKIEYLKYLQEEEQYTFFFEFNITYELIGVFYTYYLGIVYTIIEKVIATYNIKKS